MARMLNGINGPFIGKIGAVIGYNVNGNWYMKGLYKERTKPPTEKELLNREKFKAAQLWLKPITVFVRVGFKGYNPRFQGFGAAKSWLMKNAMLVIDNKIVIDPSLVKVSSGNLPLPQDVVCSVQSPTLINFTWKPSHEDIREYDQAMVLAYDVRKECWRGSVYGPARRSGSASIDVGSNPGEYHVYIAFIAGDRSRQSDSLYMGTYEFK